MHYALMRISRKCLRRGLVATQCSRIKHKLFVKSETSSLSQISLHPSLHSPRRTLSLSVSRLTWQGQSGQSPGHLQITLPEVGVAVGGSEVPTDAQRVPVVRSEVEQSTDQCRIGLRFQSFLNRNTALLSVFTSYLLLFLVLGQRIRIKIQLIL